MNVDGVDRMRGALLAAVGVVALLLAGWWWQAQAPVEPPPGTWTGARPGGSPRTAAVWQVDPATGAVVAVAPAGGDQQDAAGGSVLRLDDDTEEGAVKPSYGYPANRRKGAADELWNESTTLRPGEALIRQTQLADGESQLLRFSCVGPGELLVMVTGARAADPMTVGCDGAVAMIEITGTGVPVGVSFSPAGAAPVGLAARLTGAG
ncbi:hypothetical protein Vqi01_57090 [Micromonospora qiuiae]|uniref:Class F sortase n=1 Tax=Micromonospora qiuiae TaxID=502268 RepID=A0ABQ4JM21_9ACTN|nr:hypothetical protein [Micromonospora qiuiae]GIJ30547.1 hypothetical protein Vqi01_57090 [Micromonospora qiuiae]